MAKSAAAEQPWAVPLGPIVLAVQKRNHQHRLTRLRLRITETTGNRKSKAFFPGDGVWSLAALSCRPRHTYGEGGRERGRERETHTHTE